MASDKHPMTVRLSGEARQLLADFSRRLGISKTAVLELAVREFAEKRGVPTDGGSSAGA